MTVFEEKDLAEGEEFIPDDSQHESESEMSDEERRDYLKGVAEALIFAATEPLTEVQFIQIAGRRAKGLLSELVNELNADYRHTGRAFEILRVAGGYQHFTKPDYARALRKFFTERARTRLSRAALETLAVVAFRGPVTRIEIDEIRGVDSGGVLRTLLDRHLIAVKGRADVVGRPLLYRTTDEFLKHFGLSDISELPRHSELSREWGELLERENVIPMHQTDIVYSDQEFTPETDDEPISVTSKDGNGHRKIKPMNADSPDPDSDL